MPVITPRPAVQPLVRYTSSLKGRREGRVIRLSVNEGALGPSPRVAAALDRVKDDLHRYPPLGLEPLVEAIGAHHGIDDADRLVIGCGSDELLSCLCQAYVDPGDEVIVTQYGFLLYRHLTLMAGGVPKVAEDHDFTVSVDNILALVSERTRIVFLANPNNPTGTYLPQREVQRLRDSLPESVLLVVDAAYAEYVQCNDYSSGKAMVEAHENVVMLRTFSKFQGLAGLRIGWAYCPADIAATASYGAQAITAAWPPSNRPMASAWPPSRPARPALATMISKNALCATTKRWCPGSARAWPRLACMSSQPSPIS